MLSTNKINNRKDLLLLLLYSPGMTKQFNEPIKGRTRILKMLFIFKTEALKYFKKNTNITEDNFYDYFPWKFGPFSSQVYDDITFFLLRGFITSQDSEGDILPEAILEERYGQSISGTQPSEAQDVYQEFIEEKFFLTDKGVKFTCDNLYCVLSQSQKNLLINFKKKMNSTSLKAILSYVYEMYPDMTKKSQLRKVANA